MKLSVAVQMDHISGITIRGDSTFAMMLARAIAHRTNVKLQVVPTSDGAAVRLTFAT